MKTLKAITIAAITVIAVGTSTANAGGFFGDGGLIRGTVGKFLDKHVENPITTPLARAGTVAAGTAIGTVAGAEVGQPAIGGMIGNQLGHCVNDIFRGGDCGTRGQQGHVSQPQHAPRMQQVARPMQQAPQFGNFCTTPIGRFGPGPMNPLGAPCHTMTFQGPILGFVSL